MAEFHPTPSKDELVERYVGKSLQDILTPSVVLDLNIVKKNCARMLEAVGILNFGWRAHIKTHKVYNMPIYSSILIDLFNS
jgi:D-serine deaminase-like pyridoxal phosphate-dependent protein